MSGHSSLTINQTGGHVKAVLGPTNTGKTHYAIERMMAYSSGVMGFPLRLLAREVYDRVVAIKGKASVALITGEEKIIPKNARYYLCTAEAMPRTMATDFVAIDEIQMCADRQRGHVFTDRMLHCRGKFETLLLGSDSMETLVRALIDNVEVVSRPRYSELTYVKPTKLTRLPRRSAIVAFSIADVYGMAELIRRQKGGAAIVMGALSPRTRNAQVEMYQSGEVDYLIATDAIGMGLNMDIRHVAFAGTSKFDGRAMRYLTPAELAQVAGRAGRYKTDGTFSTLGGGDGCEALDPDTIDQIENHYFEQVRHIQWRNPKLDFSSPLRLIKGLEKPATIKGIHRHHDAIDLLALKALVKKDEITDRIQTPEHVALLWDICQIPDFKKLGFDDHFQLLEHIFGFLTSPAAKIPADFMAKQVRRLDNPKGDIDTLASRITGIRIWTYVSHRQGWLDDREHWEHVTRSVEDRLSDALHERLTQRFVDRRTAVLMRELRQRGALSVEINEQNIVSVEGHTIGELTGFTFKAEGGSARDDHKTLKSAAENALRGEVTRRAKLFANVGFRTLSLNFDKGLSKPQLWWEGAAIAHVTASAGLMAPTIQLIDGTLLDADAAELVQSKCQAWLSERVEEKLMPLLLLSRELNGETEAPEGAAPLTGLARGVAYQLLENYGVMRRAQVGKDLRQIDQDERKGLRRFGIRIGATSLYIPLILKPHATELRLMMWAMAEKPESLPALPTPGMVWVEVDQAAPKTFYEMAGFNVVGKKAIRIDMFERLADAVRPLGQNGDWFEVSPDIMGLVGVSGEDFAEVMNGIGYNNEIRMLPKPVPEAATAPIVEPATEPKAADPAEAAPETKDPKEPAAVKVEAEAPIAPEGADTADSEPELVERYFFRWAKKRKPQPAHTDQKQDGKRPAGKGKPSGKAGRGKPSGKPKGAKTFTARPPEKKADPDSPFAALAGLKDQLKTKK